MRFSSFRLVHIVLIPLCLSFVSLLASSASGQAWLTDQSYRKQPQTPTPPPLPELPTSSGYSEPPPPLPPEQPAVPGAVIAPDVITLEATAKTPSMVWYNPWSWIPKDGWSNSAELGTNGSAGNAESFSFQAGTRVKRKSDFTLFDLRLTHNRTQANSIETQNNALLYTDFERFLGKSKYSLFVKNGLEYDEFKAFDLRFFINSGIGYNFYNTKDLKLTSRFGAGTSREFGGPDDRWVPEALFGMDYEHQITKRNKLIAKVDYFPEWTDFANFRMISDLSWEYLLDEKGNLSMKIGALDRYDSTPNGRKPNDVNYSALLLYKF
jgi:putative salt-induced outer membrane protein YdiY